VHPTTVAAHKKVGYKLVDPEDQVEIARSGLVALQGNAAMSGKLVKMFNSTTGEHSEMHPTTVEAHIKAGWNVSDPAYLKALEVETSQAQKPAEKAVPHRAAPKRG
jgi:hypothetical protein